MSEHEKDTTPKVVAGVPPSDNINPNLRRLRRPEAEKPEELLRQMLAGDRIALSRAITLVESRAERHQEAARLIVEQCLPHSGRSVRVGITGSPGAGKSTFIEALGQYLIEQGRRVAVLAIDPSSEISRGSILGDKTRMELLAQQAEAFIRPSPTGGSLGGVARSTRESIILCEAAGFDVILIETVGVGQSEIAVHSMVDFFLLLLLPGAGDELQGIKRGIVEMADLVVINKADGERQALARQAKREYRNALHLFPLRESQWTTEVLSCSAVEKTGVDEVWKKIEEYRDFTCQSGYFDHRRQEQARYWLKESIDERLRDLFYAQPAVALRRTELEQAVTEGRISSFRAAEELIRLFLAPGNKPN